MSRKIAWLTVYLTLVYWLGSAFGCATTGEEQNYKIIEERRDMFDTQPHPEGSPSSIGASSRVDAPQPTTADAAAISSSVVAGGEPMVSDTAPSLTGVDRSNWRRIQVGPSDGTTWHWHTYFSDLQIEPTHPRVDFSAPVEEQMAAAVSGSEASWMADDNALALVAQPAKFAWDLLTLPVDMLILQPVWEKTGTPPATASVRNGGSDAAPVEAAGTGTADADMIVSTPE